MKSKLNLDLSDNKLNIRYISPQKKIGPIYGKFNISNKKNNDGKKRPKSSFKVAKTNIYLKNNKYSFQIKDLSYLPFVISNTFDNFFLNSLAKIGKKDNIKKYIKIINEFQHASKDKYSIKYEDIIPHLKSKKLLKEDNIKENNKENKKEIKLKEYKVNKNGKNINNIKMNKKYFSKNKIKNNNKAFIKEDKKINQRKDRTKEDNNKVINKEEKANKLKMKSCEKNIKSNTKEIEKSIDEDKKLITNENKKEKKSNIIINKKEKEIIEGNVEKIKNINEIKVKSSYNNEEISFKQKLKTYSPICDKCFRLVYISFDYISNYISCYCLYCKNLGIYKYDKFIEKINENKNPLLNSYCNKCYKSFIFSDSENPFYLIEKVGYNFYIICKECMEKDNYKEYIKKYECLELINHYLYLYEDQNNNRNKLDALKVLEKKSESMNKTIKSYLNLYDEYKVNISIIELIIKNAPLSLRNQAKEKLLNLKKEIIIKNRIIEYYKQFSNFIIINNMSSLLNTLLDFSNFNLQELIKKPGINDIYHLIKSFINDNKFISLENLDKPIKFEKYLLVTKNYLNKEECIKDKNSSKELLLNKSFLNILNINFETGETIKYNILAEYCSSEKVVPIIYNYNIKNIQYQDILIFNYKNDHKLYYSSYNINCQKAIIKSLSLLDNEESNKILNIVLLNYGEDLFILCNDMRNFNISIIFYISNFRKNKITKKYKVERIYSNNLVYNQSNICIGMIKKLIMIGKNIFKEIKLSNDISYIMNNNMIIFNTIIIFNNMIINYIKNKFRNNMNANQNNINNNNTSNNNNMNNNDMLNNFNNINNINIININNNNMNMNNIMNNNLNINILLYMFMNNILNINDYMNNILNMNIMNQDYENFMHMINNTMNNMDFGNLMIINKMNFIIFMNNFFSDLKNNNIGNIINNINNLLPTIFNNMNIFRFNEYGEKSFYRKMINLDNNYFIIGSSKHIKSISNNVINYFYLSLYSYDTLEEISKIEIDKIMNEQNIFFLYQFSFNMEVDKNDISIHINFSMDQFAKDYYYEFKNFEIIPK